MVAAQVRRVDQNVQRLAAGRSDRRIGRRGRAHIASWIGRGLTLTIDGGKFFGRIAREDKVVMQQMLVALFKPEIEHDSGAGWFVAATPGKTIGGKAIQ